MNIIPSHFQNVTSCMLLFSACCKNMLKSQWAERASNVRELSQWAERASNVREFCGRECVQEESVALRDTSCCCCCCPPNIGNRVGTILWLACMACSGFTTTSLETAKPVHLEKVRHVSLLLCCLNVYCCRCITCMLVKLWEYLHYWVLKMVEV